jgi:hypothetical protein
MSCVPTTRRRLTRRAAQVPANDAAHGIARKTKKMTKIQILTSRRFVLGNTSEVDKRKCH